MCPVLDVPAEAYQLLFAGIFLAAISLMYAAHRRLGQWLTCTKCRSCGRSMSLDRHFCPTCGLPKGPR